MFPFYLSTILGSARKHCIVLIMALILIGNIDFLQVKYIRIERSFSYLKLRNSICIAYAMTWRATMHVTPFHWCFD